MAHIETMSSARIHLVDRGGANGGSEDTVSRLWTTPLSDPAKIFRRMPTQAISPALLGLLDVMSSPILLIKNSPAGESREIAPVTPAVAAAA
jgi:hypothetical protein